jgi:myo-inositol-1(or 4)-monophosphatase
MHQPILNTAIKLTHKAAKSIRRDLGRSDRIKIQQKPSDGSWVTEIDLYVEELLISGLEAAYPDHAFLAEERGFYKGDRTANALWIIDPLDGTNNFVHGLPHIAISMAFCLDGRLEHGLVYDVMRDELYVASRGRGAYLDQRRIRVSRTEHLSKALVGTSFSLRQAAQDEATSAKIAHLNRNIMNVRRMGSAALDLAYVASGRLDACWSIGLKPWDAAAGALLVREAGGFVTDHEGDSEDEKQSPWWEGSLLAANGLLHKQLLSQFESL